MTIAVIIARGGSQRLPRKNVKPFCNLPLVAWSIIQCKVSKEIDHVYVSTDDDEIAQIAADLDVGIIRRPDWADANQAAGNRPFMHALDILEPIYGKDFTYLTVMPTSPLRYPDDLDKAIRKFHEIGSHVLVPMVRRRETFLYKDVAQNLARFKFGDKTMKHMEMCGGLSIQRATWYRHLWGCTSDLDADQNAIMIDPAADFVQVDFPYIEWQPFQVWEVDTLQEFEIAERLMYHFIIGNRFTEPYFDYNLPRAGNWMQQG